MASTAVFLVIGTAVGLVRALPQLLRLLRTRNVHGVSADTAGTTGVVSTAWAVYGVLTDQAAVALASGATALTFLLVAVVALRLGRPLRTMRTAPVWLVVLAVGGAAGGAAALGVLLPVSVLVANVPQLRVAWRERDLSGLSLGTWLLSVLEAGVWGTYGLLAGDRAILVNGVLHLATSGGIVLLRIAKPRRPGGERPLVGLP